MDYIRMLCPASTMFLVALGMSAGMIPWYAYTSRKSKSTATESSTPVAVTRNAVVADVQSAPKPKVARNRMIDPEIVLVKGDITTQPFDHSKHNTVVSPANKWMNYVNAGGAAGAIGQIAGRGALQDALKKQLNALGRVIPVSAGDVLLTDSFGFKTRGVSALLHAVGPDCRVPAEESAKKAHLNAAYRNIIKCARKMGTEVLYIPSISTGIFCYPLEEAATVALKGINYALLTCRRERRDTQLEKIVIVVNDDRTYEAYRKSSESMGLPLIVDNDHDKK